MSARTTNRVTGQLLVALALLLSTSSLLSVHAYSVRYSGKTYAAGMMNFGAKGYCAQGDSGHSMMPKLSSYQTSAYAVLSANSFTKAPIGGESRQAACLDANCTWQFSHGLYYNNQFTFFYGVYYNSVLRGGPADGVYNNFGSGQPVWWSNLSYWGQRQPYMASDGTWANDNVVTFYTQWVCEYYEYQRSDAALFPTYPDGAVIAPQSTSTFYHCGKQVERDSQGRWIYQRCKNPFPWWAGLIIAVAGMIILVAIIILICCCCLHCERNKDRRVREDKLETMADNPAQVPTQTQMGLSRYSSNANGREAEDADSHSTPSTDESSVENNQGHRGK